MDLNHLHLAVGDLARSKDFYAKCFGFSEQQVYEGTLFLENAAGFVLALDPGSAPERLPSWFHFGFRLKTPAEVKALYSVVRSTAATIRKPLVELDYVVAFQCEDPDGYTIEVSWERDHP